MKVYHFDPINGMYAGVSDATESPLEPEVFLVPAHATTTPPPLTGAQEAAVFISGVWSKVPDYRGDNVFSTVTGLPIIVTDIGPLPADKTNLAPPSPLHKWNSTSWRGPSTAELEKIESDKAKAETADHLSKALPLILTYIAAKADAPAALKTLAAQVDAAKLKIK